MHTSSKFLWLILFCSCASLMCFKSHGNENVSGCESLQSVAWLLGDWRSQRGKNILFESWVEISPKTFEGKGETRSNSDNALQSQEALRLLNMEGDIFYLAKVEHNVLPVAFKLTQCSSNHSVFENTAHDFPQKLVYQLAAKDNLSVTVGDRHDKGFTINFKRVADEQ